MKIVKFTDRLRYDEKRAIVVLRELEQRMKHRHGVFNKIVLPQDLYSIPRDKKQATHWLAYLALVQRGPIMAEELSRAMSRIYRLDHRFFDPNYVAENFTVKTLSDEFMQCVLKYNAEELAKHWMNNSIVIARKWDGDIRNAYQGVTDFEEFYSRIDQHQLPEGDGFMGMRRKIASLMTIFLQEKGLVHYFACPIPIDFQAIRIFVGTRVINPRLKPFEPKKNKFRQRFLEGMPSIRISDRDIEELHVKVFHTIRKYGIEHLLSNPGTWVIGREYCANYFGAKSIRNKEGLDPELWDKRREAANVLINPEDLRRRSPRKSERFKLTSHSGDQNSTKSLGWPKNYKDYCQHCPLEQSCTKVVPSGTYYDDGVIFPLVRIEYPGRRKMSNEEKEAFVRRPLNPLKTGARSIRRVAEDLGETPIQQVLFDDIAKKAKR